MSANRKVRARKLPGPRIGGKNSFLNPSTKVWETLTEAYGTKDGAQITESEGHPWPPRKRRELKDIGGDFSTVKQYLQIDGGKSNLEWLDGKGRPNRYTGTFIPPVATVATLKNLAFPSGSLSPLPDLNSLGAVAISRVSPVNPIAELSTALGELYRDGLPRLPGINLWRSRLKPLLGISEEILNTQFGWKPLLSDITDHRDAVRHAAKVIEQYRRDNNRLVRREFHYPTDIEESEFVLMSNVAAYGNGGFIRRPENEGPLGDVILRSETERKTWFSGAFTYHIPGSDSLDGMLGAASEADKLFGISLTPDTLWELTPWSWAIDWFSNTSEVINNFTNIELQGQVLRYGYIMDENIRRDIYYMRGGSGFKGIPASSVCKVKLTTVSKHRVRANPYGFGIAWEDLSPTQLAITAALGITRL